MIEDILYDSLIMSFETPDEGSGGQIFGYSYQGDEFDFVESAGEINLVFVN